jgi:FKBP-type peptidyl-prolyl cis-trans isomerase
MTFSMSRISLVVLVVFSAVALGLPHSALAQAPAQSTMAAQVENPPADALKTASGLVYKIESPGSGTVHPTDADLVKIATSFWTKDSQEGKPGSFGPPTRPLQMSQILLPGLHEALGLMTTGQKLKVWMPEKLAFAGAAGKPKGQLLVELVLLDVIPVPTAPADVAAPPADAQKTKSGLAMKVLKPGTGSMHPKGTSTVMVHYTGWTPDGKMFDSSVVRGTPASFPLDKVIKGWTEGVQMMVPGESCRFWIPGKLAYDGSERADAPKGMLVFDIELLSVDGAR